MKQSNDWESLVRATLREADEASDVIDIPLAKIAIARGTRRMSAGASMRVAVVGAVLAVIAVAGAYRWAEAETERTAVAALQQEVPWSP